MEVPSFCCVDPSAVVHALSYPVEKIFFVTVFFGAFGGLVAHYVNNEKQHGSRASLNSGDDGWYLFPSKFESALIGVAGALSFLFFIVAVGGITREYLDVHEQLRSVAVSVIAGFGARSLLPRMVNQLEEQIDKARAEAGEAKTEAHAALEKVTSTAAELSQQNEETRLLSEAALAEKDSESHRRFLIEKFEERESQGRLTRNGYIALGRLYKAQREFPSAISTLTRYLAKFGQANPPDRIGIHTALYNRACYYCRRFTEVGDRNLLDLAIDDLRQALAYSADLASDKDYAKQDPDLGPLYEDPRFKELVGAPTPES